MSGTPSRPAPRKLRCHATVKRTGEQCQRWATNGATVCHMHGAAAPQVRRKARQRAAVAELVSRASPGEFSDPRRLLAAATTIADRLLSAAVAKVDATVSPEQAVVLVELIKLATGTARAAIEGGADEIVLAERERAAAGRVASGVMRVIVAVTDAVLRAHGLDPDRPELRAEVRALVAAEVERERARTERLPGRRALPRGSS